jgi:hypothetical protein
LVAVVNQLRMFPETPQSNAKYFEAACNSPTPHRNAGTGIKAFFVTSI